MLRKFERVTSLPRTAKRGLMLLADSILLPLSLWTAIGLRLDDWRFPQLHAWWVYLLTAVVAIPIFIRLGLYHAVVRFIETRALIMIGVAVTISVWLFAGLLALLSLPSVPRGALLIYWMIAVLYIGSSRFLARFALRGLFPTGPRDRRAVIIYGAGSAGCQLATALRANPEYQPVLFVDDSKALQNLEVMGLRVCSPDDFPSLITRYRVGVVLLAMPSLARSRRIEIIDTLEPLRVEVRSVPGMSDLVDGTVQASDIRDIEIDELLGRESIPPTKALLAANIEHRCVMVTGAGGSIGSELCRQIVQQAPRTLILYELSEFALYTVESELRQLMQRTRHEIELVSILGSVQNMARMHKVMSHYRVQTVYHAAAYKHVPIVEFNMIEGVLNNTFGTRAAAQAAIAAGVEAFVLISTDKAVRPTNVMGASKRFAELVLQAYASDTTIKTRFCMVRFGNVLGSSGSVVPLFRRQIESGGPVTVTHPDITRYFMTIPEAAQLVIQAGAMGGSGEVFVLDMGEPVRIVDLARRMIHLSGYSVRDEQNPEGDVEIRFSGLRPGEKLYEELLIGDDVTGTKHPRIMMANEQYLDRAGVDVLLSRMETACENGDHERVIATLRACVSGFRPESEIRDHLYGPMQEASRYPMQ